MTENMGRREARKRKFPGLRHQLIKLTQTSDPITAVHYRPTKDRDLEVALHKDVETSDALEATNDWRDEVDLPEKNNPYLDEMIDMLSKFEPMWNGNLGHIKADKHGIELTSETVRPIYSAPYHSGPTARQF